MKRTFTTLLFGLSLLSVQAQSLNWAYSIQNPSNVQEAMLGLGSDGQNRFAVLGLGVDWKNADFVGGNPLYNTGYSFVAAYDKNAGIIWENPTVQINTWTTTASGIGMNDQGETFVFGSFSTILDFDPGPGTTNLTPSGWDAYLQKFDTSGALVWASNAHTEGRPDIMAFFSDGRSLLMAAVTSSTTVDLSGGGTVALNVGYCMIEFGLNGEVLDAHGIDIIGSTVNFKVFGLEIDADDNIYLCGAFDGKADFDFGVGNSNWEAQMSMDAYVVKLNGNYELQWQKRFGDLDQGQAPGWDYADDLKVASNGDVFVAGEFVWTCDFDPDDNPGTFVYTADLSSQSPDAFIMKYDSSGVLQWVKAIGEDSTVNNYNKDLSIWHMDLAGDKLYVTGVITGAADFDPGPGVAFRVTNLGGSAMFMGRYDTAGNYETVFLIDDLDPNPFALSYEEPAGIEVLPNGQVITGGFFQKIVDFDPEPGTYLLDCDSTGGNYYFDKDLFIASYNLNPSPNGIEENLSEGAIRVFPNPTEGIVQIECQFNKGNAELYNLAGQVIFRKEIEQGKATFDLSGYAAGLYVLRISDNSHSLFRKVILR